MNKIVQNIFVNTIFYLWRSIPQKLRILIVNKKKEIAKLDFNDKEISMIVSSNSVLRQNKR